MTNAITALIDVYKEDKTILAFIEECLLSFEVYHRAVYELEIYKAVYSKSKIDTKEYQDRITEMDASRTRQHNAIIANVNILNRLAEQQKLPPIYEGIASEERPYRRELANYIFEYVENVINNRA